jgi:tRNA threonylcarbamoyl adenosine modification protein (Sua5/YciO/YrdC/YwlC family)
MGQLIEIHPDNPQPRRIAEVVRAVIDGGLVVYPTDSSYALGARIGDKSALERLRRLRRLEKNHLFTLVCRDLSEIASHARVANQNYRWLRALTPGPYTFILPATKHVPKRLQHPRRRTIGIRVPTHPVCRALLEALGEPLISTTMQLPGQSEPMTEPFEIYEAVESQVEIVIDSGPGGRIPTSVLDLTGPAPEVVRVGLGDVSHFLEP